MSPTSYLIERRAAERALVRRFGAGINGYSFVIAPAPNSFKMIDRESGSWIVGRFVNGRIKVTGEFVEE